MPNACGLRRMRTLDPLRADLIVQESARVFEQMRPDHQSSRQTRAALLGVQAAERFVEALPVDQPRQPHQRKRCFQATALNGCDAA